MTIVVARLDVRAPRVPGRGRAAVDRLHGLSSSPSCCTGRSSPSSSPSDSGGAPALPPSVARRRLQLLAAASARSPSRSSWQAQAGESGVRALTLAVTLLATLSALGFLVGLAPPPLLRLAWRRPEHQRLQAAIAGLMGATTEEEVAAQVAAADGCDRGRACASRCSTPEGVLIGAHGASEEMLELRDEDGEEIVDVDVRRSGSLVVWTSRYAPYFGGEELRLLPHARRADRARARPLAPLRAGARGAAGARAGGRAEVELHRARRARAAHARHEHQRRDRDPPRPRATCSTSQRSVLRETLRDQGRRLGSARRAAARPVAPRRRGDLDRPAAAPPCGQRVEELVRSTAGERARRRAGRGRTRALEATVDPVGLRPHPRRNLVANALRYGEPPVIVRAEQRDRHFRLAVEDRGPGVPPEFVPDLFERFTRSTSAHERGVRHRPRPGDRALVRERPPRRAGLRAGVTRPAPASSSCSRAPTATATT